MEEYLSKNKYITRISFVLVFILILQCIRPTSIIAEDGRTTFVASMAPINKVAVIKSDIKTLNQDELKEIQETIEIPEEEVPQAAPKVEVKAPDYVMPTVNNLTPETKAIWGKKVTGTDKWNDLINLVSKEEGIDPVFVKSIMAVESGGYQQAHNTKNANGSQDYGLMQVNTSWGKYFDYNRMLNDPEYAIRSGIQVIKCKIAACIKAGVEPTVYEVLWRYNGKSTKGKKYADRVSKLYSELSGKTTNEYVTSNNTEKNA